MAKKSFRYNLVVMNNFSNFGRTIPYKNLNAQTTKDFYEKNLKVSERSSNIIETNDGNEFVILLFTDFSNKSKITRLGCHESKGTVSAD